MDQEDLPTLQWVRIALGGLSPEKVKSLVRKGMLSAPKKIAQVGRRPAILIFDRDEVLRLVGKVRRRKWVRKFTSVHVDYGELFAAFRAKKPFDEIVILTGIHPDRVREAYRQWKAGYETPEAAPPLKPSSEAASEAPKPEPPLPRLKRARLEQEDRRLRIKERELELREQRLAASERNARLRAKTKADEEFTKRMLAAAGEGKRRSA